MLFRKLCLKFADDECNHPPYRAERCRPVVRLDTLLIKLFLLSMGTLQSNHLKNSV